MAQVTLYLDDQLAARLQAVAKAASLSQSKWLANLIAEKLHNEWPASIVELAGAWANMPAAEEIRAALGQDAAREQV